MQEQVRDPEWFIRNDVTGRVGLIRQKTRLHRAIVLLQIPPNKHIQQQNNSAPVANQRRWQQSEYHIFDNAAVHETQKEVEAAKEGHFNQSHDPVDVPKYRPQASIGTSMFPTQQQSAEIEQRLIDH